MYWRQGISSLLLLQRFKEGKEMNRKHKVTVSIADGAGSREKIMTSRRMTIPKRLISWMFGDFCEVLVLSPGRSVKGIEISELRKGGETNEQ